MEVRKGNGSEYRGNTLLEIVITKQHYLRKNGKYVTLINDCEFKGTQRTQKKVKDLEPIV